MENRFSFHSMKFWRAIRKQKILKSKLHYILLICEMNANNEHISGMVPFFNINETEKHIVSFNGMFSINI